MEKHVCRIDRKIRDCQIFEKEECDSEKVPILSHTERDSGQKICYQLIKDCIKLSFQTTVVSGLLFGMLATLIWWLDLNLGIYCFARPWRDISTTYQRIRVTTHVGEAILTQLWSFACLAPTIPSSTIKKLNLQLWNAVAAYSDALCRLFLFVYGKYGDDWQRIIGNFIFLSITFLNHIKVARNVLERPRTKLRVLTLAFKLSSQFIAGLIIAVLFSRVFTNSFKKSTVLVKAILCSSLPVFFAFPKFIVTYIIGKISGLGRFENVIVFTVVLQVCTTIVARAVQASNENLASFVAISIVHGTLTVLDKLALPLREKIVRCLCQRKTNADVRSFQRSSRLLAHQALVGMITETSAVMVSCSSSYITMFYVRRTQANTQPYSGSSLLKDVFMRVGIAVVIDFCFNVVAIFIQIHKYNIPVIHEWKLHWRFIATLHLVQVILALVYFSEHINNVTLTNRPAINNTCIAPFSMT